MPPMTLLLKKKINVEKRKWVIVELIKCFRTSVNRM